MHYIFKYVQIYIKVLRISPNTMVYVLILTERIAEIVNSPFLQRNYGYQSMRYQSVHLYHLIISVDYVSCHWNGQTAPGQTHSLIFSLQRDITDMSHGQPILAAVYCQFTKKPLFLHVFIQCQTLYCALYCLLFTEHITCEDNYLPMSMTSFQQRISIYCLHLFCLLCHNKYILTKMYF